MLGFCLLQCPTLTSPPSLCYECVCVCERENRCVSVKQDCASVYLVVSQTCCLSVCVCVCNSSALIKLGLLTSRQLINTLREAHTHLSFITRSGFFIVFVAIFLLSFFPSLFPTFAPLNPYVFLFCVVCSLFNFCPCLLIHFLESFHLLPSCFHSFLYIFVFFFTCPLPSFLLTSFPYLELPSDLISLPFCDFNCRFCNFPFSFLLFFSHLIFSPSHFLLFFFIPVSSPSLFPLSHFYPPLPPLPLWCFSGSDRGREAGRFGEIWGILF